MRKTLLFALVFVCTATAVRCSRSLDRPSAPTGVAGVTGDLNPDGSNLKITAPGNLSPNGGTVDTRRPTLSFSNATARFATAVALSYEIEVFSGGSVVYTRIVGQGTNTTSHAIDTDLQY